MGEGWALALEEDFTPNPPKRAGVAKEGPGVVEYGGPGWVP